ncbi:hypothetical protein GCM10009737_17550 [Nocardioides lentus]|uniref:Bh protein n=1 Tax=Nocardioides lentus TaxID=338077 RepID=A0ABN2PCV6_9ACTN
MSDAIAELLCEHCDDVTDHELRYAGRLLEHVECTRCGRRTEVSGRALLPAYVADLEQRVASKPRRMLRRAADDPVGYAMSLPAALARQPVKFAREFWAVLKR